MKIVQNQYEGIPIKVFKAYYRDQFIAISKKRDRLVSYMEFHRGLDPKDYRIEKDSMLDSTYYNGYDNSILVPFCGYFLPQIDVRYIEEDQRTIQKEFQDTINKMTYMLYLFHRTKGMSEIHESGSTYLKEILEITEDEKNMKKLEKAHALSHPLVIMGMSEYLQTMRGYQDLKNQEKYLKAICSEEISF